METYEGGLAEQSVTHYYGGTMDNVPKRKGKKMAKKCKKKTSGKKSK